MARQMRCFPPSRSGAIAWRAALALCLLVAGASPGVRAAQKEEKRRTGFAHLASARRTEVETLGQEGCALDPHSKHLPAGLQAGDQIRVLRHDEQDFALFTVHFASADADQGTPIRLTQAGRKRLGYAKAEGQKLILQLPVVRPEMTEAKARKAGDLAEVVETSSRNASKIRHLLILAPHGGSIETGTDRIARRILQAAPAKQPAMLWMCLGFRAPSGAYRRWHITSTAISERSFPKLGALVAKGKRFRYALALHGHSGREILIGGQGPADLKEKIRAALVALEIQTPVKIAEPGTPLAGTGPLNIVNRYAANGIQLELPRGVRTDHWQAVADGLAKVMHEHVPRRPAD